MGLNPDANFDDTTGLVGDLCVDWHSVTLEAVARGNCKPNRVKISWLDGRVVEDGVDD